MPIKRTLVVGLFVTLLTSSPTAVQPAKAGWFEYAAALTCGLESTISAVVTLGLLGRGRQYVYACIDYIYGF